jgi:hypothetical protein
MKTSTVLVIAIVAVLYFQGGFGARSATAVQPHTVVPPEREVQPQSGGGDTFNQVMSLITASTVAFAKGVDLATDRGSQA